MAGSSLRNVDVFALHSEWSSLPKGHKGAYIDRCARLLGVSTHKIYRLFKKEFGPAKQVVRDVSVYTEEIVHAAATVLEFYQTITLKGKERTLPTASVIEIMVEQGAVEEGQLSVSGLNRALRKIGYRDVTPRVRVEADYACQQVQIDFSRSKHFQVVEPAGDGDWLLRVSAKELHYKEGEVRLRTWLTQVVDEFSRLRYIEYFAATGEGRLLGIEALQHYFDRPVDEHLFRHKMEALKSDQGAFIKSQEAISALEALGIERRLAGVENKESQGKVERGFGVLWKSFEAPLATRLTLEQGSKATVRLSDLNRLVNQFTIAEHEKPHPTLRKRLRGAMYQQSILQHRPMEVEADVLMLALRTWERRAGADRMVSIDGQPLEVPAFAAGKHVRIHQNLHGEFVGELIDGFRNEPFPVRPYKFQSLGIFDQTPHRTYSQRVQAEVKNDLKVRTLRHAAEKVRPESPFVEARKIEEAPAPGLTLLEARAEIGRSLRAVRRSDMPASIIPQLLQGLEDRGNIYDGIDRADVQNIIATLLSYQSTRKAI